MTFLQNIIRAKKQLAAVDKAISQSLQPMARDGALVFKAGAKRRVPKRTRELEKSIDDRPGNSTAVMGEWIAFTDLFYSVFVEFGTRPHGIYQAVASAVEVANGEFRKFVERHPGNQPQSFFRSTAEQDNEKIAQAMTDRILRNLRAV